jgi:hypothetical protein
MNRSEILLQVHLNGQRALRHAASSLVQDPQRPRDSGAFDCEIGTRLMAAALRSLPEGAPEELRSYLMTQQIQEGQHCVAGKHEQRDKDMARRIADFHLGVLRDYGWPGLFATMCLTGERMAMGTAVGELMVRRSDPAYEPQSIHGLRPEFFCDEFHHTTTPLLLLSAHASDEQLGRALEAQEKFMAVLGVPPP